LNEHELPPPDDRCLGCDRIAAAGRRLRRGRCDSCYQRNLYALKKSGQFVPPTTRPPLERLFARGVAGLGGCIIWTGSVNPQTGYGSFSMPGRGNVSAHRAAYELVIGPIPSGLVIDHVCHNKDPQCSGGQICIHHRCINPHHLEAVTSRENHIRSPHTKPPRQGFLTHCKHGHEFTPENTLARKNGRACRACHQRRQREYMAKRRAAAKALRTERGRSGK
jgi:hypothetical protein